MKINKILTESFFGSLIFLFIFRMKDTDVDLLVIILLLTLFAVIILVFVTQKPKMAGNLVRKCAKGLRCVLPIGHDTIDTAETYLLRQCFECQFTEKIQFVEFKVKIVNVETQNHETSTESVMKGKEPMLARKRIWLIITSLPRQKISNLLRRIPPEKLCYKTTESFPVSESLYDGEADDIVLGSSGKLVVRIGYLRWSNFYSLELNDVEATKLNFSKGVNSNDLLMNKIF